MQPVPAEQLAPYPGAEATSRDDLVPGYLEKQASHNWSTPPPHLTTNELAARWRCTIFTISNKYRSLGLRPIRIGKRLLFPMDQVERVERESMGA